jgi:hypothetical protein
VVGLGVPSKLAGVSGTIPAPSGEAVRVASGDAVAAGDGFAGAAFRFFATGLRPGLSTTLPFEPGVGAGVAEGRGGAERGAGALRAGGAGRTTGDAGAGVGRGGAGGGAACCPGLVFGFALPDEEGGAGVAVADGDCASAAAGPPRDNVSTATTAPIWLTRKLNTLLLREYRFGRLGPEPPIRPARKPVMLAATWPW